MQLLEDFVRVWCIVRERERAKTSVKWSEMKEREGKGKKEDASENLTSEVRSEREKVQVHDESTS